MSKAKKKSAAESKGSGKTAPEGMQSFETAGDLKMFLESIRDKMTDGTAAPVYAASALNHILNHPRIYDLLDKANKELARDIWLRVKQSGLQVKNPPMLFSPEEDVLTAG